MNELTIDQLRQTARNTLWMVLSAESAFFGTLIMSFIYLRIQQGHGIFTGTPTIDIALATVNTAILIGSAITAWYSLQKLSNRQHVVRWLMMTMILGGVFVIGQIIEFTHAGIQIEHTALEGAFFALMSFHALHVLGGGFALFMTYVVLQRTQVLSKRHTMTRVTVWFWYFVVAMWLLLYIVLYWI